MAILETQALNIIIEDKYFVQDLSVTFLPGQVWGIFGCNGTGKTTLLHTLAGLRKPSQGQILLNGINLHRLSYRERAQNIGLLFQEAELPFYNTVFELVLTGRYPHQSGWFKEDDIDSCLVEKALDWMGLKDLSARYVYSLSGGEKQRLMLAALLAQDPSFYLLDEPINHLDLRQCIHVLSFFKRLAKQYHKTVLMVLHHPHFLRAFCDYVITLGNQSKNIFGPIREILSEDYYDQWFR